MNSQLLIRSVQRGVNLLFPRMSLLETSQSSVKRSFYVLTQSFVPRITTPKTTEAANPALNLLETHQPLLSQVCGMKTKGRLRLRCKDCYFVCNKARWYVRCKSHPRHKQAQIVKKEKNTWILSSVCQSKKRPWW